MWIRRCPICGRVLPRDVVRLWGGFGPVRRSWRCPTCKTELGVISEFSFTRYVLESMGVVILYLLIHQITHKYEPWVGLLCVVVVAYIYSGLCYRMKIIRVYPNVCRKCGCDCQETILQGGGRCPKCGAVLPSREVKDYFDGVQ